MVDGEVIKNHHRQRFAMKTNENENDDDHHHQIPYIFIYICIIIIYIYTCNRADSSQQTLDE